MMKLLDTNLLSETPEGWVLMAQKCGECGKIAYPRKRVCPECFGEDLANLPLSATGTLHTYARTYLGVPRIGLPYVIGFVDLPERIRLFGLIIAGEDDDISIGQRMDIVFGKLWQDENGEEVFCYKFQPAVEEARP